MNTAVDVSWLLLEIDLLVREKNDLLKNGQKLVLALG